LHLTVRTARIPARRVPEQNLIFTHAEVGTGAYLLFYSPRAKTTRVTVAGVSEAQLSPDSAVMTLSVVTNGAQALNAQQDNAVRSDAVKRAIEADAQRVYEKTASMGPAAFRS
jgi:uncharacterized protein YggE